MIAQTASPDVSPAPRAYPPRNAPAYEPADQAAVLNTGRGGVVLLRGYDNTANLGQARVVYDRPDVYKGKPQELELGPRALQECARDLSAFFKDPTIAAICRAWLGPNYRMNAQVNQMRPGGAS